EDVDGDVGVLLAVFRGGRAGAGRRLVVFGLVRDELANLLRIDLHGDAVVGSLQGLADDRHGVEFDGATPESAEVLGDLENVPLCVQHDRILDRLGQIAGIAGAGENLLGEDFAGYTRQKRLLTFDAAHSVALDVVALTDE